MAERRHIARGLRFTLTLVYASVFTLLLLGVSVLFRQYLASSLDEQAHDDLNQAWAVVKGYLRIENDRGQSNYHAVWFFDQGDPEDNSIGARVQRVILIAKPDGGVLWESPGYEALGTDSVKVIQRVLNANQAVWWEKRDRKGVPYLIRASYIYDETTHSRKFYVALGTALAENAALLNRFTWLCVGLIPLVILTGCITGWIFAGRALKPVLEIAQAAQRIGGSNLSLRIPSRKAGDELDYLIETFNEMIERLETNFNRVRQFSTDVSHELRTPITVVRGQLEVALFTAQTADQYREAIVNSLADIERLSQIVRALLLLSQAETGQVILQKQHLDLVELADSTADQFQIPAEGAEVELKFIPKVERCMGDFDRVQIERMLSNLLSNAIKFTPPGGRIRVIVDRIGGEAEILVEDTGQGIPPEHLPHIFDRFYRVRGPSEQASPEKGLGLGLSFVAWIARAHGGTVDVRSQPGQGTTFRIRLPLQGRMPPKEIAEHQPELMKPV
ncbi:MAG TPA: heavy metal sensor histidine kinase [Bryobacteraceae bacterium]|nr:heavy metal sensor histidine kinase [Bryobacteraceae bacterium]